MNTLEENPTSTHKITDSSFVEQLGGHRVRGNARVHIEQAVAL